MQSWVRTTINEFKKLKKNMISRQLYSDILILSTLFILITGCASIVKLPCEEEQASLKKTSQSIVLIRNKVRLDQKLITNLNSQSIKGFALEIAEISAFEQVRQIIPYRTPSKTAKDEGWLFLTLKPGTYYLQVIPGGAAQNPAASARDIYSGRWGIIDKDSLFLTRTYWFQVTEKPSVVYLGSLTFDCITRWGLLGRLMGRCSDAHLNDETKQARLIYNDYFYNFGPFQTSLLKEYAPSVILPVSISGWNPNISGYDAQINYQSSPPNISSQKIIQNHDLYPMGISTTGAHDLLTPSWMIRAIKRTTGLGSALRNAESLSGGYPPGALAAGYLLFYLPPATIIGTIRGQWETSKWEPCMKELAADIDKNPPASRIEAVLENQLKESNHCRILSWGNEKRNTSDSDLIDLKSFLYIEVVRIQLRECAKHGLFLPEIIFRCRLANKTERGIIYDRTILYSAPFGQDLPAYDYDKYPYLFPLGESATCREMDAYCVQDGKKILDEEIKRAVHVMLKTLAEDLNITFR